MLGNILQGSYIYGDMLLGVDTTEVTANISNSTSRVVFRSRAVLSSYHTKFRIPELDIIVDLSQDDEENIPKVGFGSYGSFEEFGTTVYAGVALGGYSLFMPSELLARGPVGVGFGSDFSFILEHPDNNSIAWSNIGSVDFTIGQDNVAGKMPVDWKGYVYAIEQLADTNIIYVYGDNGITRISPNGIFYGRKQVSNLGIKSKHSVVNTKDSHYFISKNGNLYRINRDNTITKLGYAEFLSVMGEVVMSWDGFNQYVYICDGATGYIYSEDSDSLTEGPSNVTGIRYRDSEFYVGAPTLITIPEVLIVSDIYDMGTKKEKTIFEIIVGVNDTYGLQVAVDYRLSPLDDFKTIPFKSVGPLGKVVINCYGREFRFRVKGRGITSGFKIESLTVNGIVHGFSFLDTLTMRT